MTAPDGVPECMRKLVRPRLALRTAPQDPSDAVVGVWGGSGVIPLPADRVPELDPCDEGYYPRHWISVDCDWLERNGFGLRGCLSVYVVGCLEYVVLNDPNWVFVNSPADGLPLFGQEEESWPEEEALVAYLPSDEVRTFVSSAIGEQYLRAAQQRCPLYRDDLVAVLGGWHVSWPDGPPDLPRLADLTERINRAGGPGAMPWGETFRCEPYRLLLWTLRDSEPWVEVWGDGAGELHAVGRIT